MVREGTGDECSCAHTGFEITFGEELGVGGEDGNTGDAQFGSESTGGGDLLAGGEVAADDSGAEAVVDLAVERTGRFAIDEDEWGKGGRGFAHAKNIVVILNLGQVVIAGNHFFVETLGR